MMIVSKDPRHGSERRYMSEWQREYSTGERKDG